MNDAVERADGMITEIAARANGSDRVLVRMDNSPELELAVDLAVEAGLGAGVPLSAAEQIDLLQRDHALRAREAALRYLSDQSRTAAEVRRALNRRGFGSEVIDGVIAYVESQGYVNDAQYARAYAQSRFSARGYGPARLRDELIRRGVDRAIVDEAVADLPGGDQLTATIRTLARARYRALAAGSDERRRKQKTLEYLVRRGYSFDEAREAIEHVARDEGAVEDET